MTRPIMSHILAVYRFDTTRLAENIADKETNNDSNISNKPFAVDLSAPFEAMKRAGKFSELVSHRHL